MKTCKKCGAENQPGAKFCGMCQAPFLKETSKTSVPRFSKVHIVAAILGLAAVIYILTFHNKIDYAAVAASMSAADLDKKGDSAFASKDYSTAMNWYQQAAIKGDSQAENFLGWFYQNGLGVEVDNVEAMNWYQKSAAQGNTAAETNVGWLYQNGLGVEKNYGQAIQWYQKAVAQGNESAEIDMGYLYENGIGVAKDYDDAKKWYQMAANHGNQEAQKDLDGLKAKMVNLNALLRATVTSRP